MRTHRLFLFGLVLASAITLLLSGIPELVAGERITLKYGHSLATDHPYHKMALKFKEELEKRNKNVVINIFPLRQLGNERDLTEGAQLGSIDITTVTSAIVAGFVPGLKAFSLPFLFRDEDQMFRVMDSDIGKAIDKDMAKVGLISLGHIHGGSRDLYSSKPIRNLQELRGKKVRTMENRVIVDTWNALGAVSTPMNFADLYVGLKMGVVDGGEGTGASYKSTRLFEVAPCYTRLNYYISWKCFFMSKKTWDKFPTDLHEDIMAAAKIAVKYERKIFSDLEKGILQKLKKEFGVTVYYPDDLNKWRAAIKDVYSKNAKKLGGMDYIKRIQGL